MQNTKELLLGKEMTRAEFLKFGLMAALALFGINNFMSFLHQHRHSSHTSHVAEQTSHGFGSSKFGI